MLKYLKIKNFAIIKDLEIEFNDNLNVITGNTGSGKSILFSALSLVLAERADKTMIRAGEEFLSVTANIDGNIVIRTVNKDSQSKILYNDEKITLNVLKEKIKGLIDIHGQFDSQEILDEKTHLKTLDDFLVVDLKTYKDEFKNIYREYVSVKKRLDDLKYADNNSLREIKILNLELNEIKSLDPKENEEEELKENIRNAKNFETISKIIKDLIDKLDSEEGGVNSNISKIENLLKDLSNYFPEFIKYENDIENSKALFTELFSTIKNKAENISPNNDDELDMLITRLDKIENLKKSLEKNSIKDILEYKEEIEQKIIDLSDIDKTITTLETQLKKLNNDVLKFAKNISKIRKDGAKKFKTSVVKELNELAFQDAKFDIYFNEIPDNDNELLSLITSEGFDNVSFLLSTNKGSDLRPLVKIASGGEISRIMLAIKTVMKKGTPTLIFDEIDTGISGKEALIVGQKLAELSTKYQIILTTHLPQIAIFSNVKKYNGKHLRITKNINEDITSSTLNVLSGEESINEIARLLSGKEISSTALNQVKELIKTENKNK